jgi:hypothetical protein
MVYSAPLRRILEGTVLARLRWSCACPRAAAILPNNVFKDQVPPWLSLKEKHRRIVVATAVRMMRFRLKHSMNARTVAN